MPIYGPFPLWKGDFAVVTPGCVRCPSPALALMGPAVPEKPPAETLSYFHGIPQEKPTGFMLQLGNWDSNPSSFPTVKSTLPSSHSSPLALGSAPSMHQGRQRGCTSSAAQHPAGMILLTNKPFFPSPVSEQKPHFPQLIQCYWSTLLPYKNHI